MLRHDHGGRKGSQIIFVKQADRTNCQMLTNCLSMTCALRFINISIIPLNMLLYCRLIHKALKVSNMQHAQSQDTFPFTLAQMFV